MVRFGFVTSGYPKVSKMLNVVQVCAAPATGKNSICQELCQLLTERDGEGTWALTDNEYGVGGYSPIERYLDSLESGIQLDSKEFGPKFNLPRQLKYQSETRRMARLLNRSIIMPGPFEDLTIDVPSNRVPGSKISLLRKLRDEDFDGFKLTTVQVILTPNDWVVGGVNDWLSDERFVTSVATEFESRIRQRIESRIAESPLAGEAQIALDADKLRDVRKYAIDRTSKLLHTSKVCGTTPFLYRISEEARPLAVRMVPCIPRHLV